MSIKMPFKFKLPKEWVILTAVCIVVFMVGFTSTYFFLTFSKIFVKTPLPSNSPAPIQDTVSFAPAPETPQKAGVYNTVFLGYGGGGHSGSLLTDSIIVVHVDTISKTAALITIPRDLWVNGNHKINAEASINGFQNEGGVIKNVTGLPVDYFVSVDFSGFVKLIDNLGGITVDVPKTVDDPYYPVKGLENETCGKSADEIAALKAKYTDYQLEIQFTCRYEYLHFDKGQLNLNGTTALKFVRSRHGDSDFGRSERQVSVLKGILAKLISLHAFDKTNQTISTLSSMVRTNLSLAGIRSLIDVVGDTGQYKIKGIHLTTDNVLIEGRSAQGAYILNPRAGVFNFTEVKGYINSNIN